MTVRNAVEKAKEAPTVPVQVSPAAMVRTAIEKQSAAFSAVLPSTVDPDRFSRLMLTAIKASPELMGCFGTDQGTTSILLAGMQAASIGLEPNTPTQDAWILPRKNRGVQEAELSIGSRGLMKLARRSGRIKSISAHVVKANDHFEYSFGLDERLEHRPAEGDRGDMTHAWALAKFTDGGHAFEVLTASDVMARKAMSMSTGSKSSPWNNWPEAMWRKSAIRALVPFLELSAEDSRVVALDETPLSLADFDDTPALEAGD